MTDSANSALSSKEVGSRNLCVRTGQGDRSGTAEVRAGRDGPLSHGQLGANEAGISQLLPGEMREHDRPFV
jgi:hypothetical protein